MMKNLFSRVTRVIKSNRVGHALYAFLQKLVEPAESITVPSERRQVKLISTMLLVIAIAMISGVILMGFFTRTRWSA
jgi:hypothetical protein